MTTVAQDALAVAHTIVIKIGSALLTHSGGDLRSDWLMALGDDIAALRRDGKQVLIVTSGAVALGFPSLGFDARPKELEKLQAAAALGQVRLIGAYEQALRPHQLTPAQILVTLGDMEDRSRYLNARGTVDALMAQGIVPVINENDSVATAELRFGDNDRLAARIAQMAHADLLILLSDIDGLYSADPKKDPAATRFEHVPRITDYIASLAGGPVTGGLGSGGMITKVEAARFVTDAGCKMVIMDGQDPAPVTRLAAGCDCTLFDSVSAPLDARRRWIRGLMSPKGFVHIDAGAAEALRANKSLLPKGVTDIVGTFGRGDLVGLSGPDGHMVGQGLASYNSREASLITGCQLDAIPERLGYGGRAALVHRDDLVVF